MTVFEKITNFLQAHNIPFRVMEHIPEGRSEFIAKIRGNDPHQALKAMVLMAKINKHDRKYFLAIIPGDKKLDMVAIKNYAQAEDVMFAPLDRAQALTECEMGAVPPFTFNPELHLIVDPMIQENQEVVFNAGALDRSVFMSMEDYVKVTNPVFVKIAK